MFLSSHRFGSACWVYLYGPRGSFLQSSTLLRLPCFSSSRCRTPVLPGHHLSLDTTISGFILLSFSAFGRVFYRLPDDLIIETFQQIAGEKKNSKGCCRWKKITMCLVSVQMPLHRCSCHLLTICLISCGTNTLHACFSVR